MARRKFWLKWRSKSKRFALHERAYGCVILPLAPWASRREWVERYVVSRVSAWREHAGEYEAWCYRPTHMFVGYFSSFDEARQVCEDHYRDMTLASLP